MEWRTVRRIRDGGVVGGRRRTECLCKGGERGLWGLNSPSGEGLRAAIEGCGGLRELVGEDAGYLGERGPPWGEGGGECHSTSMLRAGRSGPSEGFRQ